MKPTDFSMHLTAFLADYLPIQKNVSRNTIRSYRDTFKLLLLFCEKEEAVPVEKLTMKKLSPERIERFLDWLETERKSSISTTSGIRSAHDAGCFTVMIPDQDQPSEETKALLHGKADSLAEIIDLLNTLQ